LLAANEKVFATAGHSVFHQAGTDADCCFIVEMHFIDDKFGWCTDMPNVPGLTQSLWRDIAEEKMCFLIIEFFL
jgi:hypothetical protein